MSVEPLAIIGMDCVFPGALDLMTYWQHIVDGIDCVTEIPPNRMHARFNMNLPPDHDAAVPCKRGGFIPDEFSFDPLHFGVMPGTVEHGSPEQFLMMHVAGAAMRDAGIADDDPRRAGCDVIVGRGGYTSNKMAELYLRCDVIEHVVAFMQHRDGDRPAAYWKALADDLRATLSPGDVNSFATMIPNLVASRIANRLNLEGSAYLVDAACAGSLVALEQACDRLRQGVCDTALVGGIYVNQSPLVWYVFSRLDALSPTAVNRPFDRRADGILIGEGAGAVVLRRLSDAQRDGARIHAVIRSVRSASDGRVTGVLAPSSAGQVRALSAAFAESEIDPSTIGYLETHGTATPVGDAVEMATIRTVYGEFKGGNRLRAMGSVKSMIGHTMSAAGMAGLIKAVMAVKEGILPPSLHCEEPADGLATLAFALNRESSPWPDMDGAEPRRAGINSFGFGGINAHAIVEAVSAASSSTTVSLSMPTGRSARLSDLLLFETADQTSLAEAVRDCAARLRAGAYPDAAAASVALANEITFEAPWRFAFVTEQGDDPAALLEHAAEVLASTSCDSVDDGKRLFFSHEQTKGKMAVVFPGIGAPGEHAHHLRGLCLRLPALRRELARLDWAGAIWKDCLAEPRQPDGEERGDMRWGWLFTVLRNWAGWSLLRQVGVEPDAIVAHSAGELPALCAAGCLSVDTMMTAFRKGFEATTRSFNEGESMLVAQGAEQTAPYLERVDGVWLAMDVSADVCLVGGRSKALSELAAQLRKDDVLVQALPFPALHTPLYQDYRMEIERWASLVYTSPDIPVYSAATAALLPDDPAGILDVTLKIWDNPLLLRQLDTRLRADGYRLFVQLHGGAIGSTAGTRADALTVAMDADGLDGLTSFHRVLARLFVAGRRFSAVEACSLGRDETAAAASEAVEGDANRVSMPLRMEWIPFALPADDRPAASPVVEATSGGGGGMPFLGRCLHYEPNQSLVMERVLDLKEDLYLQDHCFLHADIPLPLEERFPVLPMTMSMELMAECAACLAPGMGLVGMRDISSPRWIALVDGEPVTLQIEAVANAAGGNERAIAVRVSVDDRVHVMGTCDFAHAYDPPAAASLPPRRSIGQGPIRAEEYYMQRLTFHGPRFQVAHAVREISATGIVGTLNVRHRTDWWASNPAPDLLLDPIALDGAGQMLGIRLYALGEYVLPLGVDSMSLYGPPPPVGSKVRVEADIVERDDTARVLRCSVNIYYEDGRPWLYSEGWRLWILPWSDRFLAFQRDPERLSLAEPLAPAGLMEGDACFLLKKEHVSGLDQNWCDRYFFSPAERQALEAVRMDSGRAVQWLMGRIAVKDAVRTRELALGCDTKRLLHEIVVMQDERGRPVLDSHSGSTLSISITHTADAAIGVASARPVGIDMEPINGPTPLEQLAQFTSAAERSCIERMSTPEGNSSGEWATRSWCAKEATAKCAGTGLQGKPLAFEITDFAKDGGLKVRHQPTQTDYVVRTSREEPWIVAIAYPLDSVAASETVS